VEMKDEWWLLWTADTTGVIFVRCDV